MGDAKVSTTKWRFVERGRVVSFSTGPFKGRLAAIVDIIDHKRVCQLLIEKSYKEDEN